MNFVYASCTCSKRYFSRLYTISQEKPGQQVQKYHHLIMDGLYHNGHDVATITAPPVTRGSTQRFWLRAERETEQGICYQHLAVINLPVIKNIGVFLGSFFQTLKTLRKITDRIVICDVLNITVTAGALLAARMKRTGVIGLVTDVPEHLEKKAHRLINAINNAILRRVDGYVFLTEDMNTLINRKQKPYRIIEGQVDHAMKKMDNTIADKNPTRIVLYAGGLQIKYGIKTLVQAFLKTQMMGTELHIFGNGEYEDELKMISRERPNVHYWGVMPNERVIEAEIAATLLVNPRPASEIFTRYSFPSKNMEYMVSGTPVLTTRLPGMPPEYNPYVYFIEDESVDGLSIRLTELLTLPREQLHKKGMEARNFVLNEKNNIIQSRQIIELARQICPFKKS